MEVCADVSRALSHQPTPGMAEVERRPFQVVTGTVGRGDSAGNPIIPIMNSVAGIGGMLAGARADRFACLIAKG